MPSANNVGEILPPSRSFQRPEPILPLAVAPRARIGRDFRRNCSASGSAASAVAWPERGLINGPSAVGLQRWTGRARGKKLVGEGRNCRPSGSGRRLSADACDGFSGLDDPEAQPTGRSPLTASTRPDSVQSRPAGRLVIPPLALGGGGHGCHRAACPGPSSCRSRRRAGSRRAPPLGSDRRPARRPPCVATDCGSSSPRNR